MTYPFWVEGSYSDDKVKSLLDRLGTHSYATHMAEYKMEGFLQRSVSIPNWKLPPFTPGMEKYRIRYWIKRLPTFAKYRIQNTENEMEKAGMAHVPAVF